ncbi:cytochrome c [Thermomonas paludicola]|uniref:cytochrome c n=1 Tax=Thermomonas paludicola TaxID=2884874 RepID=UPI002113FF77|nr:cytochrome c [Thermomonas paludicola]
MSTSEPVARKPNAGRYLFLLLLGLAIGVVATVMALRALEARKDHFPAALMEVQGWHMGQLKSAMEQNRCNPTDVLPHLQALRMTSNDLEPAFADLRDDERFRSAAAAMRGAVDKAIAAPPMSCESLAGTMKSIGDTCKGCHRDFK